MIPSTCFKCGHAIGLGKPMQLVVPSSLARSLGDFNKVFHPACYIKAEQDAKHELEGAR